MSGAEVLVTKAGTHDKAFAFVHLADGSNLATVKAEYAEDVAALIRAKLNPEAVSSETVATVEPRGCPTPGACSCPGAIPDAQSIVERATVDTPRTDSAARYADASTVFVPADFARTLERELIDLKQRILPQFQGRAQRAEHERDALLEQLIAARSATGAPVAWMYTEDGERMFGHPDGYRPLGAVPLYAGRHPDAGEQREP